MKRIGRIRKKKKKKKKEREEKKSIYLLFKKVRRSKDNKAVDAAEVKKLVDMRLSRVSKCKGHILCYAANPTKLSIPIYPA